MLNRNRIERIPHYVTPVTVLSLDTRGELLARIEALGDLTTYVRYFRARGDRPIEEVDRYHIVNQPGTEFFLPDLGRSKLYPWKESPDLVQYAFMQCV